MTETYTPPQVWFAGAVISVILMWAGWLMWLAYQNPRQSLYLIAAIIACILIPYGIGKLALRRLENG